jgi:hypothetical protein
MHARNVLQGPSIVVLHPLLVHLQSEKTYYFLNHNKQDTSMKLLVKYILALIIAKGKIQFYSIPKKILIKIIERIMAWGQ